MSVNTLFYFSFHNHGTCLTGFVQSKAIYDMYNKHVFAIKKIKARAYTLIREIAK